MKDHEKNQHKKKLKKIQTVQRLLKTNDYNQILLHLKTILDLQDDSLLEITSTWWQPT
jgi:hypothetical protein